MRDLLLALATVGGLVAGASTFAQTFTVNSKFVINVTGFNGGPNTLPDAVAAIEGGRDSTRVAAIAYNNNAGTRGYGIITVQGSKLTLFRLEAPNGRAVEISEKVAPPWMLNWRNQKRAAIVRTAKVSLADAIRKAEASEDGAPAVVAGIARSAANSSSDVHAYMVGILKKGNLRRVAVDSETGSVIEDSSALTL
jgi:hypothetical protein